MPVMPNGSNAARMSVSLPKASTPSARRAARARAPVALIASRACPVLATLQVTSRAERGTSSSGSALRRIAGNDPGPRPGTGEATSRLAGRAFSMIARSSAGKSNKPSSRPNSSSKASTWIRWAFAPVARAWPSSSVTRSGGRSPWRTNQNSPCGNGLGAARASTRVSMIESSRPL